MAFLVLAAIMIGFSPGIAQQPSNGNVKIEVRKTQDGQLDVQQDNRAIEDVGNLQDLLNQYGVSEELGDLQPGEEVEIIIRRRQKEEVVREMIIDLDSDRPERVIDIAPRPPMPPKAKRPLLGVYYSEDTETGGGRVTGVMENTAAEKAEIQENDIIIQFDKTVIQGLNSLQEAVASHESGDKVSLVLLRDGKKMTKKVTLGENNLSEHNYRWKSNGNSNFHFEDFNSIPNGRIIKKKRSSMKGRPMLGVTLNISRTMIDDGNGNMEDNSTITVQGVLPGSAASEMGVQTGDEILRVNDKTVKGIDDIRDAMEGSKAGDDVTVFVERNDKVTRLRGKLTDLKHDNDEEHEIRIDKRIELNNLNFEELENMENVEIIRMGDDERVIIHSSGDNNDEVEVVVHSSGDIERGESKFREFHMTISMSDVSSEEAEALSAASGKEFQGQSNLEMARFAVGPNPNSGMFNLSFDIPTEGRTQLRVVDLNGQEIYTEDLGNFRGEYNKDFDISNFSKGVYFLEITQGDRAYTKKVITQ